MVDRNDAAGLARSIEEILEVLFIEPGHNRNLAVDSELPVGSAFDMEKATPCRRSARFLPTTAGLPDGRTPTAIYSNRSTLSSSRSSAMNSLISLKSRYTEAYRT